MMSSSVPILLLTLSSALSTLSAPYDGYTQVVVPQKRAALMLDRLLMALQKALHEDGERPERDGPRAAPLRIAGLDDVGNDMIAPKRRGQGVGRADGRVLRCYFNAITCF
uniref:Allatostatin CC n=1 Tax=Pectinophora gossypiella TaxID=13191 RepID=A0A1E1W5Y5_PECGO